MRLKDTIRLLAMTAAVACGLPGCQDTDVMPATDDDGQTLSLQLSIPATDASSLTRAPEAGVRRVPGDPGTYETLKFPRYLYVYTVSEGHVTCFNEGFPLRRQSTWSADDWTAGTHSASQPPTYGDDLYTYQGTIDLKVKGTGSIRVYAVASPVKLTLRKCNTEEEVLNVTADLEATTGDSYYSAENHEFLRDIYVTPYNLGADGNVTTERSQYYASLLPSLGTQRLLLYHLAARLDLTWNIAPADQPNVHLTNNITIGGLKHKNCLLFRPMENDALDGDSYTETFAIDESNQWMGRCYTYVVPYIKDGAYPFTATVHRTYAAGGSGETGSPDEKETDIAIAITDSPVFTPWIRALLNIK